MTRAISWTTGILTLLLAAFSFRSSLIALSDLAAKMSFPAPGLFPWIVEFAVVIFSLNALYRSMNGEDNTWQWTLIIFSSLVAGTFNVLHAPAGLVSRAMAAMPSLFLLLSFETFLGQVRHAIDRSESVKALNSLRNDIESQKRYLESLKSQEVKNPAPAAAKQSPEKKTATAQKPKSQVSDRRESMKTLFLGGHDSDSVYKELYGNLSVRTFNNDIKAIREDPEIASMNGRIKCLS